MTSHRCQYDVILTYVLAWIQTVFRGHPADIKKTTGLDMTKYLFICIIICFGDLLRVKMHGSEIM